MDLRELVAQSIFSSQWRLRRWDTANNYTRRVFMKRAEEAMKRAGVENMVLKKREASSGVS